MYFNKFHSCKYKSEEKNDKNENINIASKWKEQNTFFEYIDS